MPWKREKPSAILQRIQAEMDATTTGAPSRLRWTVENVLARVITMAVHQLEAYLAYIARQIHPLTADAENLENLHAGLRGMAYKDATAAFGNVTFTGTNGIIIPAGTALKRSDNVQYTLSADVTISGGSGTGAVTADAVGAAGNSAAGVSLSLVVPIAGIQSAVTVASGGLTGGVERESEDGLRGRVVERWQTPPQGGAKRDYIAWAKEVAGVTRAWVYPLQTGEGTVAVIFVMDNKEGTIIPSAGEVQVVQDYIDEARPVTADVTVTAPTAVAVDFTININPNSVAVQAAIQAELEDLFLRESEPGGTLYLSRIQEAISLASGEFDHVLVSPAADVTRTYGQISILGDITYGDIA